MDTFLQILYSDGYATYRNKAATRSASSSSDGITREGEDRPIRSGHLELFREFSGALVPVLSQGGQERTEIKADSRTSPAAVSIAAKKPDSSFDRRSPGRRSYDRPLDAPTHRSIDPKEIRSSLHARRGLETVAPRSGVELAETRETGNPTKRARHSAMDASSLEPYKKKPENLKRTWRSSMKAGSFSFPMFARLGLLSEKLQFFGTATDGTRSLSSPASPFLRNAAVGDFTLSSMITISRACRSSASFVIYFITSEVPWFFSGMAEKFTALKKSNISLGLNAGSMSTDSPVTRLNSIQMNLYGPKPSATYPTALMKMFETLAHMFDARFAASIILNIFCDLVFISPVYRGLNDRVYPLFSKRSI